MSGNMLQRSGAGAVQKFKKGPRVFPKVKMWLSGPDAYGALSALYLKGEDATKPEPVWKDPMCLRMLNRFSHDPSKLMVERLTLAAKVQPYRTMFIDKAVDAWLTAEHSNNADGRLRHVVELGVGFDLRCDRIESAKRGALDHTLMIHEVDTSEVSLLRKEALEDVVHIDSVHSEAFAHIGDLSDATQRENILDIISSEVCNLSSEGSPLETFDFSRVLFVAEALFLHLGPQQTADVLTAIWSRFPGAHFVCDETLGNAGFVGVEKSLGRKRFKGMVECIHRRTHILQQDAVWQHLGLLFRTLLYPVVRKQHNVIWFTFKQQS